MIRHLLRLAARIAMVAAVLLVCFAAIEFLRGYQLFRGLHPSMGWAYLFFFGGLVVALTVWLATSWLALGRPLVPPPLPKEEEDASFVQSFRYVRYLERFHRRLAANPLLSEMEREQAAGQAAEIRDTLRHHPLRDDLWREIRAVEDGPARRLLKKLKRRADEEISRCVRDVMLGVTLSPYHSVDLLLVLYRNGLMILRIARIFHARPPPREQLLIVRDTLRVVAAVNLLNLSRTLMQSLFSHVPIIGRVADDIAQGVGAGWMTSLAGHAAAERCCALHPWDTDVRARSLASRAGDYAREVRDIFTRDILPCLWPRLRATMPMDPGEEPVMAERIHAGIGEAATETLRLCRDTFLRPATAGSRRVVRAGRSLTRYVLRRTVRLLRFRRHNKDAQG